jgi:4-amino-4-deoxy-L-arabinose transferase-like glycosyltransferase
MSVVDVQGLSFGTSRRTLLLLCLLAAVALLFAHLDLPLLEPEEALYAEVPREMLAAGSWLVPVHRGQPYYEKPPLFSWLIMACYGMFGVHEWVARLVPCSAALATVLVTFWWGRKLFGFRAGLLGAIILCLSPRYVHQARMIAMDGLFCLWITAALALGQQALASGRRRWRCWLLSALACGLGLLTKGPTALILTVLPLLVYQVLTARAASRRVNPGGAADAGRKPRRSLLFSRFSPSMLGSWLAYFATAAVVALPWYAAMMWRDAGFLRDFFWTHHVLLRFVQPMHEEPFWFYLPLLPLGMLPWSLLVPDLVRAWRSHSDRPPVEMWLLLASSLWCLVFFSMADCKRIGYILPAMPTLALALGYMLDWRLDHGSRLPLWTTLGVLGAGSGGAVLALHTELLEKEPAILLAVLALVAVGWVLGRRQTPRSAWTTCALAMFAVLLAGLLFVAPNYYRRFSMCDEIRSAAGEARLPVVCYPHHWDSINYYLKRDDVRVYDRAGRTRLLADLEQQPATLVFVKSGAALNDLLSGLSAELEFVTCGKARTVTAGLVRRRSVMNNLASPRDAWITPP